MIENIGRSRVVESAVRDFAPHGAARKDLCQIVYLHLLDMDFDLLSEIWKSGMMDPYIRRVAYVQLYGHRTDYDREIRQFSRMTRTLNENTFYPGFCEEQEDETPEAAAIRAVADLPEEDRDILFKYADVGSLRALGKMLGISGTGALKRLTKVRRKIYDNI